jgi:hypothetical protein
MPNILFNNAITSSSFLGVAPKFTKTEEDIILANIFEQLLLFDKIVISTDKDNYALAFLINRLGLETVERLIRSDYINFSVKAAIIVTSQGRQRDDGTLDESTIYSQPPIVGGSLGKDEIDPEKNVLRALRHFHIDKKKRNDLIKKIVPKYIITDNMNLGGNSAKIIIDAYTNNNLANLGLPFSKDPYDLNVAERGKLLDLGNSVLVTSTIALNGYKSYNNFEQLEIAKQNLENIGKAYKISENVSELLRIENTPNLKEIYLDNSLDISDVFKIRHLASAKYFRKWINEVGENSDSKEVTEAYLAEIKGEKKFINTTKGKLIKNTLLFGATTGIGGILGGAMGMAVGAVAKPFVEIGADYGFGLLEEFVLNGILEGKNPKIFIDKLKAELKENVTQKPF